VIPHEPLPPQGTLGFRVQLYGMTEWGDLFTARQKLALSELTRIVSALPDSAAHRALALAVSKLSELACALCAWEPFAECPRHVFGRQALPIAWDFGEGVLSGDSSGAFPVSLQNVVSGIESVGPVVGAASLQVADACESPLPGDSASIWFTDPPYYDAVPYADLSDFFFVWLKRGLPDSPLMRDPFDPTNPLTPKLREIVQDEVKRFDGKPKDRVFFEGKMARAFAEGRAC
jgi:putative DNA methylase